MANSDIKNGFTVSSNQYGQDAVKEFPVAASQTITKGDFVILASGLIQIALATSPQLLGIAAHDITTGGSVDRNDVLKVTVALPGIVFEGQGSGSSVASLIGGACDIEGATGIMEVNENATTEDVLQIIGFRSDEDPNYELGLNDRIRVVVLRSQYIPFLADK